MHEGGSLARLPCSCSRLDAGRRSRMLRPASRGSWRSIARSTLANVQFDLSFTIPSQITEPIDGTVLVTVDLMEAGRPVIFDFVGAEERVQSVTVDGQPVAFEARDEHVIVPRDALARGTNTVPGEPCA